MEHPEQRNQPADRRAGTATSAEAFSAVAAECLLRTPKDIACSLCYPPSSSPRPGRTMERVSPGASGSQSLSSLWCRSAPAAMSRAPNAASMGKRRMQMAAVQIGASGCRCQCSHLCRNARPATEQRNRLATVLGGANGCRCRSNRRSLDAKAVATPWQVRRHWHWRKPPAPQAWLRRDCPVGAQRGVSSARGACAAQRVERASRPASCRPLSSCKP